MKKRLPRKLKKAMLTEQRLLDKSLGYKCRRALMRKFMYQKYLTRLYKIKLSYTEPISIEELKIANNIEKMLKRNTNFACV